jgi:hypothetical protein
MITRAHFAFRIGRWDQLGDNILDHVAGIEDIQVAQATFEAACKGWPGETIAARRPHHRGQPQDRVCLRASRSPRSRCDISGAISPLAVPTSRCESSSRAERPRTGAPNIRRSQARVGAILATPVLKTPQTADPRLPGKGGKIFYCRPCD